MVTSVPYMYCNYGTYTIGTVHNYGTIMVLKWGQIYLNGGKYIYLGANILIWGQMKKIKFRGKFCLHWEQILLQMGANIFIWGQIYLNGGKYI